jgi:hypothetical protein
MMERQRVERLVRFRGRAGDGLNAACPVLVCFENTASETNMTFEADRLRGRPLRRFQHDAASYCPLLTSTTLLALCGGVAQAQSNKPMQLL